MPLDALAAAPRLLCAPLVIHDSRAAELAERQGRDLSPGAVPEACVPFMLDLDTVESVRAVYDFDAGRLSTLVCVQTADDAYTLAPGAPLGPFSGLGPVVDEASEGAGYRSVVSAWVAYRQHADALGRLRN